LKAAPNGMDIRRDWETIIQNIKATATECVGYYEAKQHKP